MVPHQKVKEEAEEKHAMRDENTAKTIDQAAVEAVDEEFDLALIGTKGKWYDHKVSVSNPELVQ